MSSNTLLSTLPEVIPAIAVSGLPIDVGILPDGTPFMSGRELARACGISNSTLVGWGEMTPQVGDRHRAGKLANSLATYRYQGDRLFVPIPAGTKFGSRANVSAYPYQVCLAFLDYYAFAANKEEARNSLRLLSEQQLPQFICATVEEPAQKSAPQSSTQSQEDPFRRPLRNGIPVGYFDVGQALADDHAPLLLTPELRTALLIHIEKAWNRYWNIQQLSHQYGDRFPIPQQRENSWAQLRRYVYPAATLVAFQDWLAWHYLPDRYPSYLQRKRQPVMPAIAFLKPLPQAG